jgi:hypothetical protein
MNIVGVEVQLHSPVSLTLYGGEWSVAHPGLFTAGRNSSTHWTGGWVCPRAGLDGFGEVKSFALLGLKPWTTQLISSCYTDCTMAASRHSLEVNITIDLQETRLEGMDWINLF